MDESTERSFKGVWIPKEIWLSKELSLQEKVFLAEIDSLDNEKGCYATNAYFAEFFGLSKGRVSQVINGLEQKGIVQISYIYKEGSKEIEKRVIRVRRLESEEGVVNNLKGVVNILKGGYLENAKDNNLDYKQSNRTNNLKDKSFRLCASASDLKTKPSTLNTPKNDNTSNQKIFDTKKETSRQKKVKEIVEMRNIMIAFSQNPAIRRELEEYFNFRLSKGLSSKQWKIILDDLYVYARGDVELVVEKIRNAHAGGFMQIIAPWEKSKASQRQFKANSFDNTIHTSGLTQRTERGVEEYSY